MKVLLPILGSIFLIGIFLFTGCKAELEKIPLEGDEFPMSKTPMFYIAKNQIYRSSIDGGLRFFWYGEDTLTRRRMPRLNYQRTRLAILEGEPASLVILDMEGNKIDQVAGYPDVTEMAWSTNGESLFIVQTQHGDHAPIEQSFHFWGEPFDLPFNVQRFTSDPDLRCDGITFGPDSSVMWGEWRDLRTVNRRTHLYYRKGQRRLSREIVYNFDRVERISYSRTGEDVIIALRFLYSTFERENIIRFSTSQDAIYGVREIGGRDAVIYPDGTGYVTSGYTSKDEKRNFSVSRNEYTQFNGTPRTSVTQSYYTYPIEIELK
ncbi:MAG: hypothetical protein AB8F95_06305 [Bacteroidia bacterium]